MNIDSDDFSLDIENYISENFDDIPIINIIKIDQYTVGRLDIVMNRYYSTNIENKKFLMIYNNIVDESEMQIGMQLVLPNIDYMIDKMRLLDTEKIPGIAEECTYTAPKNITSATKLGIELTPVTYDSKTGYIKF